MSTTPTTAGAELKRSLRTICAQVLPCERRTRHARIMQIDLTQIRLVPIALQHRWTPLQEQGAAGASTIGGGKFPKGSLIYMAESSWHQGAAAPTAWLALLARYADSKRQCSAPQAWQSQKNLTAPGSPPGSVCLLLPQKEYASEEKNFNVAFGGAALGDGSGCTAQSCLACAPQLCVPPASAR